MVAATKIEKPDADAAADSATNAIVKAVQGVILEADSESQRMVYLVVTASALGVKSIDKSRCLNEMVARLENDVPHGKIIDGKLR